MSSTASPTVRVVCVVYHPGDELERFAATLATATARPYELVVVDNGDDHEVARAVVERHGATLVVPGANLGYGAGANAGAAPEAGPRAPWLVVANSDVE